MLRFRPATPEDAHQVAQNARDIDRREWEGLDAVDVLLAVKLRTSIEGALMCWTALEGDNPVAVWGVTPYWPDSRVGIPWLICTPRLLKYRRNILVQGKEYNERMLSQFSLLVNMVHADNHTAINWLKALGYTVEDQPVHTLGRFGDPYLRFFQCASPQPLQPSP